MPMSKKFALIGGRNMSVFDINQITEDKSSFIEDDQQSAVIINRDGSDVILPVRTGTSFEKPGYYISPNNPFGFIRYPDTEEEKKMLEDVTGFTYDRLWNRENAGLKK